MGLIKIDGYSVNPYQITVFQLHHENLEGIGWDRLAVQLSSGLWLYQMDSDEGLTALAKFKEIENVMNKLLGK